ncbi:MAG: flagellar basal body L-ring protein FlgH [bacterium]|nr:flagellar basal body L-ring protein FlgH [bacterium]MCP5067376.1 flagellar basal body L-ring protein FlgH [bacterium]
MWSSRRRVFLGIALLVALTQLGCVETAMRDIAMPRRYPAPPRAPGPPPTEGAIWSGGTAGGSFLYFDRKARGIGDLVTVLVAENPSAAGTASTELDHSTTYNASLTSDIGFTQLLQEGAGELFKALGIDGAGGTAAAGEEVNVISGSGGSEFDGDGQTARSGQFTAIVTCRVVDVLPGGVFHVFGQRQIAVNHDLQWITVEGLLRREDISIDNTAPSSVLADAKLTYDGIGVIDDKQRPPLISRLINWVYPF